MKSWKQRFKWLHASCFSQRAEIRGINGSEPFKLCFLFSAKSGGEQKTGVMKQNKVVCIGLWLGSWFNHEPQTKMNYKNVVHAHPKSWKESSEVISLLGLEGKQIQPAILFLLTFVKFMQPTESYLVTHSLLSVYWREEGNCIHPSNHFPHVKNEYQAKTSAMR